MTNAADSFHTLLAGPFHFIPYNQAIAPAVSAGLLWRVSCLTITMVNAAEHAIASIWERRR